MTVQVLHEKCERNKADDKKLPSDSFLVTYKVEEEVKYDVARGAGVVEIFDHYYDKYKNVLAIVQSDGKVAPKLWRNPEEVKQQPKGKKKK